MKEENKAGYGERTWREEWRILPRMLLCLLASGILAGLVAFIPSLFSVALIFRRTAGNLFYENLLETIIAIVLGEATFMVACRGMFMSCGDSAAANARGLHPGDASFRWPYLLLPLGVAVLVFAGVGMLLHFELLISPSMQIGGLFIGAGVKTELAEVTGWARYLGFFLHLCCGVPMMILGYRRGYARRLAMPEA